MKYETSAGGIVFKKSKDKHTVWLVCQHSKHKGWVFPKGLVGDVDYDESLECAALRETKEEGGVETKIVAPLDTPIEYFYTFEGRKIKKKVYYFLMEYISGDPKNHDWEIIDARFVNEDKVSKLLTYQSDRQAFEQALRIYRARSLTDKASASGAGE